MSIEAVLGDHVAIADIIVCISWERIFFCFEKSWPVITQNVSLHVALLTLPARIIYHLHRRRLSYIHKVSTSKQNLITYFKTINKRKNIFLVFF